MLCQLHVRIHSFSKAERKSSLVEKVISRTWKGSSNSHILGDAGPHCRHGVASSSSHRARVMWTSHLSWRLQSSFPKYAHGCQERTHCRERVVSSSSKPSMPLKNNSAFPAKSSPKMFSQVGLFERIPSRFGFKVRRNEDHTVC